MPSITALERLLSKGQDSALLRYGLASAHLKTEPGAGLEQAAQHLKVCLALDPAYTAAYKLLAKGLRDQRQPKAALKILKQGIICAESSKDMQAKREMEVFARRLRKELGFGL